MNPCVADVAESSVDGGGALGMDLEPGRGAAPTVDSRRPERDLADRVARILIIVLFSFMAVGIGSDFLETGRLTGLLLLASEALVVVLTVFAGPGRRRSQRARAGC